MRRLVRCGLKRLQEILHRFGQRRLIVLDREDIVRAPIADRLGDAGLCPHGVDGHDAAFQRQGGQQFGNGRLLVRLLRGRLLTENDSRAGGKGADQVQGRAAHRSFVVELAEGLRR